MRTQWQCMKAIVIVNKDPSICNHNKVTVNDDDGLIVTRMSESNRYLLITTAAYADISKDGRLRACTGHLLLFATVLDNLSCTAQPIADVVTQTRVFHADRLSDAPMSSSKGLPTICVLKKNGVHVPLLPWQEWTTHLGRLPHPTNSARRGPHDLQKFGKGRQRGPCTIGYHNTPARHRTQVCRVNNQLAHLYPKNS